MLKKELEFKERFPALYQHSAISDLFSWFNSTMNEKEKEIIEFARFAKSRKAASYKEWKTDLKSTIPNISLTKSKIKFCKTCKTRQWHSLYKGEARWNCNFCSSLSLLLKS